MQPRAGRQSAYCASAEELVIDMAVTALTTMIVIGMNEEHIGLLRIFSLRRLLRRVSIICQTDDGSELGCADADNVRAIVVFFAK